MSKKPPKKPDPERDLHSHVRLARMLIVAVFLLIWFVLLESGIFHGASNRSNPYSPQAVTFSNLLMVGGPLFLITYVPAWLAWNAVWDIYLKEYNRLVDEWNTYCQDESRRQAAEAERRHQLEWEENYLKAEIIKTKQGIETLRKRRQELSS